jgi:uncharacterized protein YndB with AHSA1/START domain
MKLNVLLVEDYPHPVEKVWQSLTEPAALRIWLMENDFEPRVGKRFVLRSRQPRPGNRGWVECEVLELEHPRKMVWSWIHNEGDTPTRVEFRLEEVEAGTRLTLSHTGEIDEATGVSLRGGWPSKLADLRTQMSRAA